MASVTDTPQKETEAVATDQLESVHGSFHEQPPPSQQALSSPAKMTTTNSSEAATLGSSEWELYAWAANSNELCATFEKEQEVMPLELLLFTGHVNLHRLTAHSHPSVFRNTWNVCFVVRGVSSNH
jgi:hypothetical protein